MKTVFINNPVSFSCKSRKKTLQKNLVNKTWQFQVSWSQSWRNSWNAYVVANNYPNQTRLTGDFEGEDVLQQPSVLGLFGECVWAQSVLVLLHSGDSEGSSQTISTVAHRFRRGELSHGRKLHTHIHTQIISLRAVCVWGGGGKSPSKVDSLGMCTSGARWAIRMPPIRLSLWPRVLALLRDSMVFLILRLWRIGTSDMNSTPPATTVSHWPAAIRPTASDNKREDKKMSAGDKCTHAGLIWFYVSSPVGCIFFKKRCFAWRIHLRSLQCWRRCRPWWRCVPGSCLKTLHPWQPEMTANSGRGAMIHSWKTVLKWNKVPETSAFLCGIIPLWLCCWFWPLGWRFHRWCGQQHPWVYLSSEAGPWENPQQNTGSQ